MILARVRCFSQLNSSKNQSFLSNWVFIKTPNNVGAGQVIDLDSVS